MSNLNIAFISYCLAIVLGSNIEWIVHKEFMHSVKWMRTPHRRHAIEHHSQRRAPGKFFAKAEELQSYHLFETSFMPILWMMHSPLFFSVYYMFGAYAGLGVAAGTATYVFAYEILHWYIHCPENFIFKDSAYFKFVIEHHRRHHNRSDINYNVVCPIADFMFGTLSYREVRPEPEWVIQAEEKQG